jgi:hypothetical protein
MVRLAALAALVCCFDSIPAFVRADPITITGGALTATGVFGSTTFILTGKGFAVAGGREPGSADPSGCSPCVAGDIVSFNGQFAGESTLGSGPAILNGLAYSKLFYAGRLGFEGGEVEFPGGSSTVNLVSPFALSSDPGDPSFLQGFLDEFLQGTPVFSVALAGQGVATATYTEGPQGLFNYSNVTYAFQSSTQPVPEPTSVLLLATGLVGIWRWQLNRSRQ